MQLMCERLTLHLPPDATHCRRQRHFAHLLRHGQPPTRQVSHKRPPLPLTSVFRHNFVYLIILNLGIGSVLPWNAFSTANSVSHKGQEVYCLEFRVLLIIAVFCGVQVGGHERDNSGPGTLQTKFPLVSRLFRNAAKPLSPDLQSAVQVEQVGVIRIR